MSLRPAAHAAPPPAWRGGAETGALVVAPASRLHLVLAAGQRSAETSGKGGDLAAKTAELLKNHASATTAKAKEAISKQIVQNFAGKSNAEIIKTIGAIGLKVGKASLTLLGTILKGAGKGLAYAAEHGADLFAGQKAAKDCRKGVSQLGCPQ